MGLLKKDLYKWLIIENITTIIAAVLLSVFLVWFMKSLWGLLGLLMLLNIYLFKHKEIEVECPECKHKFKLSNDDDD